MKNVLAYIFLAAIFVSYFAASANSAYCVSKPDGNIRFFLFNNYWHTGFIIKTDSLAKSRVPLLDNFSRWEFVDIGWGESDFYRAPGFNAGLAAKAVLWPTDGILRVEGIVDTSFHMSYADFLIEFRVDSAKYKKLLDLIGESAVSPENKIEESGTGRIIFFESPKKYHLFYTCNTWVFDLMKQSGIVSGTAIIVKDEDLFFSVSPFGKVLRNTEFD